MLIFTNLILLSVLLSYLGVSDEDRTDAEFFRAVQAIMLSSAGSDGRFDASRSLNFIPASKDRQGGSKHMVIQWVSRLRQPRWPAS